MVPTEEDNPHEIELDLLINISNEIRRAACRFDLVPVGYRIPAQAMRRLGYLLPATPATSYTSEQMSLLDLVPKSAD